MLKPDSIRNEFLLTLIAGVRVRWQVDFPIIWLNPLDW